MLNRGDRLVGLLQADLRWHAEAQSLFGSRVFLSAPWS